MSRDLAWVGMGREVRMLVLAFLAVLAGGLLAGTVASAAFATSTRSPCHKIHGHCVKPKPKPKRASKPAPIPPPQPVDPMLAWSPMVETFYQDTLATIRAVGTALQDWVNGTSQPNELQSALVGLGQCEATLARDTGATPNVAAAQSAMTQLHTVCSLLSKAANEIGSFNVVLVLGSENDLGGAVDLLRSVVSSLGQPT